VTLTLPPSTCCEEQHLRSWAGACLEQWRSRLVPEWDVSIEWDLPTEGRAGARASCRFGPDDFIARVRLADGWAWWDRLDIETVLIHELLHLVLRDVQWVVRGLVVDHDNPVAHEVLVVAHEHELELVIWRQATAMCSLEHHHAPTHLP
jgi:hypothetical protein